MKINNIEKLATFCKQYGFVYPGSEIYGGLANSFDYGPLGVELKQNLKNLWWTEFVRKEKNMVGLDSSIILNPKVLEASGHVGGFNDPLIDCKVCKNRFRADKLIEDYDPNLVPDKMTYEEMEKFIKDKNIECSNCQNTDFTNIRSFELMLETYLGVTKESADKVYLRPETAQGIFINFKNIQRTSRKKIPFGIAQIGKSFRNEITPGNFIFRTREFEQMEIEYFIKAGTENKYFDYFQEKIEKFLSKINISKESYNFREHDKKELAHYSNRTVDVEYDFPFGRGELWGLALRGDFDLLAHQKGSGIKMDYLDPETNEKYIPHVIEPSVGVERLILAILNEAYCIEENDNEKRELLKLPKVLAPYEIAVLPLVKKFSENAEELFNILVKRYRVDMDIAGSIGKRYKRQDVIGTPFCVTFDYDSLEDKCVTVRERDSMVQERIRIEELEKYMQAKLED